jgi:hypothetical protein
MGKAVAKAEGRRSFRPLNPARYNLSPASPQPGTPMRAENADPARIGVPSEYRERGISPMPSQIGTPVRAENGATH